MAILHEVYGLGVGDTQYRSKLKAKIIMATDFHLYPCTLISASLFLIQHCLFMKSTLKKRTGALRKLLNIFVMISSNTNQIYLSCRGLPELKI